MSLSPLPSEDSLAAVLAEYNPLFLDMMIGIVTSATVVSYALYTVSPETVQRFHTDRLLLTLPFVLYGIFRYLYLVYHKNHGGDPSRTLVSDGPFSSISCFGCWHVGLLFTRPIFSDFTTLHFSSMN